MSFAYLTYLELAKYSQYTKHKGSFTNEFIQKSPFLPPPPPLRHRSSSRLNPPPPPRPSEQKMTSSRPDPPPPSNFNFSDLWCLRLISTYHQF